MVVEPADDTRWNEILDDGLGLDTMSTLALVDAGELATCVPERRRLATRWIQRARGRAEHLVISLDDPDLAKQNWGPAGSWIAVSLEATHPRHDGTRRERTAIETFPHAIACALAGKYLPAKDKAKTRRALLETLPVDTRELRSIDQIDAALCAWTAHLFAQGGAECLGDTATGFIVTPPLPGKPRQEPSSTG